MNSSTEQPIAAHPASSAQQRLWFLDRIDSGNPAYNMAQAFLVDGDIDIDRLEACLNGIIDRYSALRTTFAFDGELPVQKVHGSLPIRVRRSTWPSGNTYDDDALRTRIAEIANRPFDLATGPLIRCDAVTLPDDRRLLVFGQHHIVFDRTSEGLFLAELSSRYNGDYDDATLPAPLDYADYVQWRTSPAEHARMQRQLTYWVKRLADWQQPTLPTDVVADTERANAGRSCKIALHPAAARALQELAKQAGCTKFMAFLAVLSGVLRAWTGQESLVIGTPFSDRRLSGTASLLGFFVNHLALRLDFDDSPSFSELLQATKRACFDAYRRSDVPFEALVAELRPDRQVNRNPIFDIEYSYQVDHADRFDLQNAESRFLRPEKQSAQYDLRFTVKQGETECIARLEYRENLFEQATIERLLDMYDRLLRAVVKTPDVPLATIDLVGERERRRIVTKWNRTAVDYPRDATVDEIVSRQAAATPDGLAVISGADRLTYAELERRSGEVAAFLAANGPVGPGTYIGICIDRSSDMLIGILGILKTGSAYLPLDRNYPTDRIRHMLADSGADRVLIQEANRDAIPDSSATLMAMEDAGKDGDVADSSPDNRARASDAAYIIYTSGSTGIPKGVVVEHRNVVNFLTGMRQRPGIASSDVLLAVTTLSFDIAVLELFLPLIAGATVVIANHDDVYRGERLAELISEHDVSMLQATPVTWRMLIAAGWQGRDGFRALCGGEALPRDLARELLPRVDELWNMYGPTETTVWSTCSRVRSADKPILIGRPIANTTTYILDDNLRPVPIGVAGNLYIGGDGVTRGYHERPELNRERFVPDPFGTLPDQRMYLTGDAARYRNDGTIEYLGRLDNQVKVRGNRIELGEIEAAIAALQGIRQAAVVVVDDVAGEQRIAAYYECDNDEVVEKHVIMDELRSTLPNYMLPQYLVELDAVPLTPNGKLDRKRLPTPTDSAGTARQDYRPPASDTEKTIAAIWQELLDVDRIDVRDNFVELGGHSLLALRAIARIERRTGRQISPVAIIGETLEQIAAPAEVGSDAPAQATNELSSQPERVAAFVEIDGEQIFTIRHVPPQAILGAAILVAPVLNEAAKSHLALTLLADRLARNGIVSLRYDHLGMGDSAGSVRDGTLDVWQAGLDALVDRMASDFPGVPLTVAGIRFGATLAALSEHEAIDQCVLWDPVTSGSRFVDQLEDHNRNAITMSNVSRRDAVQAEENEILGYACGPDLLETIRGIDLRTGLPSRANRIVCCARDDDQDPIDDARVRLARLPGAETGSEPPDSSPSLSIFLPGPALNVVFGELLRGGRG